VKKREFQVGELDQLKLKTVVLHDDRDKEIHMTQPAGFVAADLVSINGLSFLKLLRITMCGLIPWAGGT